MSIRHITRDREGRKSRKLKEKEKESIPDAPILLSDGRGRLVPPCASGRRARPYAWLSLLQEGVRTKHGKGGGRRWAGAVAGPRRGPWHWYGVAQGYPAGRAARPGKGVGGVTRT